MLEPAEDKNNVSSLQAMLVSTASRVGTGNIVGVSTAIYLGGPGACFYNASWKFVLWDNAIIYLNHKKSPSKGFIRMLSKVAIEALKDYESQKAKGEKPVFIGKNINLLEDELDYWK